MKAMKGVTINRGGGVTPLRSGVEVGNHKPHPGGRAETQEQVSSGQTVI